MTNKIKGPGVLAGIFLLSTVVFISDLLITKDAAITVLYVAPVLLTLFYPGSRIIILVSAGCTILTLISYFISSTGPAHALNLAISITGIWSAFYFIMKFKAQILDDTKSRERLNALFEFATEGMIIANNSGEIIMINPMAEKQFGYQQGELTGKKIEMLIPERLSERHVKHREKYVHNPYPRPMGKGLMLFGKRKDGSEFPVEISLSNFATEKGKFVIAFIIDISERKKSDELLRKEKEVAQMYLDIAPLIFLVLDKDYNVSLINQNGCLNLGYSENEIIGKKWFDEFVTEETREWSKKTFADLLDGKFSVNSPFENEITTSTGEHRLIAWKNTIIRDETGSPMAILSAGEDITSQKQQEQVIANANRELQRYSDEILKLNADLEKRVQARTEELAELIKKLELTNTELAVEIKERKQAEELLKRSREEIRITLDKEKELGELKSRFVTMASHEFRTPLSTILSSASLISKYNEQGLQEKMLKHIERIKSAVHNLTSILNDFLSIGKLEEGMVICSPITFDITVFSKELVSELKEVTKPGQTISYEHHGSGTNVFLDKNLTRNICINQLSNAIKYSGESTSITLQTFIADNHLRIIVSDKGIGIPEEEQQYIFERFFRANNASNIQGTGLGLNIVMKYTELMDGTISFESKKEQGTSFVVNLPMSLDRLQVVV